MACPPPEINIAIPYWIRHCDSKCQKKPRFRRRSCQECLLLLYEWIMPERQCIEAGLYIEGELLTFAGFPTDPNSSAITNQAQESDELDEGIGEIPDFDRLISPTIPSGITTGTKQRAIRHTISAEDSNRMSASVYDSNDEYLISLLRIYLGETEADTEAFLTFAGFPPDLTPPEITNQAQEPDELYKEIEQLPEFDGLLCATISFAEDLSETEANTEASPLIQAPLRIPIRHQSLMSCMKR